jgi:hypothetical protein
MSAAIIPFKPKPKPIEVPPIPELSAPNPGDLKYLPPGMTSRHFDRLLHHLVCSGDRETGSAICKALDRAWDAEMEMVKALNEVRRLSWAATWRRFPRAAGRIAKKQNARAVDEAGSPR